MLTQKYVSEDCMHSSVYAKLDYTLDFHMSVL